MKRAIELVSVGLLAVACAYAIVQWLDTARALRDARTEARAARGRFREAFASVLPESPRRCDLDGVLVAPDTVEVWSEKGAAGRIRFHECVCGPRGCGLLEMTEAEYRDETR